MNLNEAAEAAYKIALARQSNGGNVNINNILKHAAGEVMEAQEAYIYFKYEDDNVNTYAEELADIILCVLIAARRDGVNIEKAVCDKMEKNAARAAKKGDKL